MTPGRRRDCSCTIGDNDDSDDTIDKHNDDVRRHDNKRRCVVPNYGGGVDMTNMVGQQGGPPPHAFQMLQDENLQLRTQLQELEKRVSDLTATNEFLLDQNAQLRMGVKQVASWYYISY